MDFYRTLEIAISRTSDNYDIWVRNANDKILEECFDIYQVALNIDITKYYDKYTDGERAAIDANFGNNLSKTKNGKQILTVAVHGDDTSILSYFGDKSSSEDQKRITSSGFCHKVVDKSKQQFLDLI